MRTVVVSDLHLGAPAGRDLLRRARFRDPLLELLETADRFVILGDGLELRHAAQREMVAIAAPFLRDVGRALRPGAEILMLSGNHDHALISGWIDRRLHTEAPGFLGLEHRIEPEQAGTLAVAVAELCRPARVTFAYPGVWLRDDVYATHGHYSDMHTTVPTFERVIVGAMGRWAVRPPPEAACPDDYEAALSPIYAWMNQLTQRSEQAVGTAATSASMRGWSLLTGPGARRRPVRTAVLRAGYAGAVASLSALGIGPLQRDISPATLRRAGLYGMSEVVRRLGVSAAFVLFGHTHRSGPWPTDDAAEWTVSTGSRLVNTGSWVYQPHFLPRSPNTSPYWPGTAVVLDDGRPPVIRRLLGHLGHDQLRAAPE